MLHGLISALASNTTTLTSAAVCAGSIGYIRWKMKGGNLLFRAKKNDDSSTTMFKALLAFGFTYGALMVAMPTAAISALLFLLSLLAKLIA